MTIGGRVVLLVSSYAPLLFLFAALQSFGAGWPSRVCVLLGVLSIVALGLLIATLRGGSAPEVDTFEGARNRDADVMAYLVTYVVPFAAATDGTDHGSRVGLAMFAGLVAVLYLRSSVYYVHPLLLLYGIHVHEATRQGVPVIILTRQRFLRQSADLRVISIGDNVYMEKSK
ncbi:hypothetical protein [Nocardioides sp. GY 10127]|uniref:hypothetical protein n=1 Tax=Nocardioides sp. GY 10127 TaxID=2569762 RepID=UPI0010A85FA1|nr:hypothetical protein [Nocardioides sp. GY 10127]TIC79004.1 hypothetical protein E8D37_18450 [Nocardioides sp. GY 10127]